METISKTTPAETVTIPKRSLWSIGLLLLVLPIVWVNVVWYFIPQFTEMIIEKPDSLSDQVRLMWTPVIAYLLLSVVVCLIARVWKPIKEYDEGGLIGGIVGGLLLGIGGLFLGVGCFLIGIIPSFLNGFTGILIIGFILGITGGFIGEFKK